MKCPSCTDSLLVMSHRQGVEIDYCAVCRGVGLDRDELDKLIERATTVSPRVATPGAHREFEDSDYPGVRNRQVGRRKSWLNDIFD